MFRVVDNNGKETVLQYKYFEQIETSGMCNQRRLYILTQDNRIGVCIELTIAYALKRLSLQNAIFISETSITKHLCVGVSQLSFSTLLRVVLFGDRSAISSHAIEPDANNPVDNLAFAFIMRAKIFIK